jgi:hypothetical protein
MRTSKGFQALVGPILAFAALQAAHADTYMYTFDTLVHGTTTTTPPWGSLSFTELDATTVQLQLTLAPASSPVIDLPITAYDKLFFFNYGANPGNQNNLNQLGFSWVSGNQVSNPQASNINTNVNGSQLDGDGYFDIRFTFANNVFNPGETSTYNITRAGGLLASDFNFRSSAEPTSTDPFGTGFFSGLEFRNATANGTGNTITVGATSGSIIVSAVPEPESCAMLFAGLGLLGFIARRRKHLSARTFRL